MTEQTQDTTPLVSVVIPTYNRSKELARAIKSVLNQTYQDFEILVVDDGSEEDLKVICDSFNDQRIKFLRNDTHTNANVARNRGIKEAQGEYIAMLDSDDEYLPHHLSRRVEKIKEWDCDGIFGSAYIDNGEEQTLKLSRPLRKGELMINYLLSDGFAQTSSHFYKANAAKAVLWDETLLRHQDYDFSVRFADKFEFLTDYTPTIIINWKQGNTQKLDFIQIQSALSYILTQQHLIKKELLIKYLYLLKNILNDKDKNNHELQKQINNKVIENIKFVSLANFLSIKKPKSKLATLRLRFIYTFELFRRG